MAKKIIDVLNEVPPGTVIEKKSRVWEVSYLAQNHVISAQAVNLKTAVEYFLERLNHEKRSHENS